MTKKSKRKALKTGCKDSPSGKYITSVHLSLQVDSITTDDVKDQEHSGQILHHRKRGKNLKGKKENLLDDSHISGKEYPLDIWYHVSKWIKPNQIKTFSLICQNSWSIACTLQFWLSIYHKYVPYCESLPLCLQPQNIDARPGIMPRVVRALFLTYSPFKGRSIVEDPGGKLIGRQCLQFWWEKGSSNRQYANTWQCFFKFRNVSDRNKYDFGSVNSVFSNSEKCCSILKTKCTNFIYLPSISGMILTSLNICMSSDMRYHQLKMTFHNERRDKKYHKNEGLHLVMNPVVELGVYDWWHPSYPYLN